jgi:hypothetical protein
VALSAERTYILTMNEKDVVDRLGPPGEIVGREQRMRSRGWVCSACREFTAHGTDTLPRTVCAMWRYCL